MRKSFEWRNLDVDLYFYFCRDFAEGVSPRVNRFFQSFIDFTIKCVEADTYIQELLQSLCRIFTVTQKPFYSRYGPKGGEVRVVWLSCCC